MRDYTPPPVDAKTILRSPIHFIAFGFGSGLSPKAPGTIGTLAAIPFWLVLARLDLTSYLLFLAVAFAIGCWLCGLSAKKLGVHDHGGIVFDEFVGLWVTCIPMVFAHTTAWTLLQTYAFLPVAFAWFRLFDIWKPWPISALDRHIGGGLGIMLDDLLAGLVAAVCTLATQALLVQSGLMAINKGG